MNVECKIPQHRSVCSNLQFSHAPEIGLLCIHFKWWKILLLVYDTGYFETESQNVWDVGCYSSGDTGKISTGKDHRGQAGLHHRHVYR